jgi:hypothetical protein
VGGRGRDFGHFVVLWRQAEKLMNSDSHLQDLKIDQHAFKALPQHFDSS